MQNMTDRAIGIVGIALTILAWVLQYLSLSIPNWVLAVGFCAGLLLLGVSIGLILAGRSKRKHSPAKTASLRLHIFGDHRTPDRLEAENIFRWFYLQSVVNSIDANGATPIATFCTLFITFDPDVVISTLSVRSPDMPLPIYAVNEFNQRFAIITFSANVPPGTLEVTVGH